jgi:hypothetical protein
MDNSMIDIMNTTMSWALLEKTTPGSPALAFAFSN